MPDRNLGQRQKAGTTLLDAYLAVEESVHNAYELQTVIRDGKRISW